MTPPPSAPQQAPAAAKSAARGMTEPQFDALVARLEAQARSRPALYKVKVVLLASLGNAYLLLIGGLALGALGLLLLSLAALKWLALKLIVVVGFFLWTFLKAVWVRVTPPDGVAVEAAAAPALFAMIAELRRQLGAPPFHRVLITSEFNAGVCQVPRLGLFGWPRNYLLIGLPLMAALSREQFRAVLAHEFGHLAGGHGRLSNWIYRQRLRWGRLLALFDVRQDQGSLLFRPFLHWYAPYFNAFSFPLARANEYHADAASARLTSPQAAAAALTRVSVLGAYLEEQYWPAVFALARQLPSPQCTPFAAMSGGLAAALAAAPPLDRAMARATSSADTHPALQDRLRALGAPPCLAPEAPADSAEALLGDFGATLAEHFDGCWQQRVAAPWGEHYHAVQEERRQLAALDGRVAAGEILPLADALQQARLSEDAELALARFRLLHARAPDDAVLCLELGGRLLLRDEAEGVALLEEAMARDAGATRAACTLLAEFHARHGREDAAQAWRLRLAERVALEEAAQAERSVVTHADTLEPHGLPPEVIAAMKARLAAIPGLKKACLVRKRLAIFPEQPLYVLGFQVTRFYQPYRRRRAEAVLEQICSALAFPGQTRIVNVEGPNKAFARRLARVADSRLL